MKEMKIRGWLAPYPYNYYISSNEHRITIRNIRLMLFSSRNFASLKFSFLCWGKWWSFLMDLTRELKGKYMSACQYASRLHILILINIHLNSQAWSGPSANWLSWEPKWDENSVYQWAEIGLLMTNLLVIY